MPHVPPLEERAPSATQGASGRQGEATLAYDTFVNTQTPVKDYIPGQQPFKEILLPRVGLEPTTFSVLG